MDTITQGLLGAVTAHLGFRQKIGRDAGWAGVLAATVPDLDIFLGPIMSAFGAGQQGILSHGYHRGITHSLLFAPILSLPLAFLWLWLRRSLAKRQAPQAPIGENSSTGVADQKTPSFWLLYACIFVAVITHPLLDMFTSYGTQIFAPFSNYRYAFDSIGIVDLIYTSILIVTLIACYFVARRKWRIAARMTVIIGWCGFLLSSGYIATGRVLHDYAISRAIPLAAGQHVESSGAFPAVGSIFLWRVVIKTDHQWIVARVHVFSDAAANQLQSTSTERQDIGGDEQEKMLIERANLLPEVQNYKWFSNGLTRVGCSQQDGETIVEFQDMRYGYPLQSQSSFWPMQVIFGKDGDLLGVFEQPRHAAGRNLWEIIDNSWHDMWNP